MNTNARIFLSFLLGITILSLSACGGTSKSGYVDNSNHPIFVRKNATGSKDYSPNGNITQVVPTFSWKLITGATDYRFGHETTNDSSHWRSYTVSQNQAGCGSGVPSAACSFTPNDYTFPIGIEKVWWIQAKINGNWQSWSPPIIFTVVSGGTGNNTIPTQISPSGTINTNTPSFTWSAVSGSAEYKISYEDADTSAGWTETSVSASEANCASGQTCAKTISSGFPSNHVAWWVKARDSNGAWGDWSAGLSFTIDNSSAQVPNEAFQFFCNGIDNRPALGSLDNGVIYNGKRYFVVTNANNSKTLKVSDSNGNNVIDVETFSRTPNLSSIDGAVYISDSSSNPAKHYRIPSNGAISQVSSFTTRTSSKFAFVNGFDFYILSSARPPSSIFRRYDASSSTNTDIISYFRGQVAFSTYYQNGVLYYSHRDRSVTTETTLGMINSSSQMQEITKCN